jgi:S1-C subfamily serine protease
VIRGHAIGVAALVACLVAAGCGASASPDTIAITSTIADARSVADTGTIIASTMRVRADGCGPRTELGTATAIGDGVVVTAAHVLAGSDQVALVDAAGQAIPVEVVLFDPDLDVAALRATADAPAHTLTSAPLRVERGAAGETGVLALVASDGTIDVHDVVVMQRVTIRTTDITRERDVERPGLRIDAAIEPGDSGAMVHLAGGGAGIVWSRSTTTAAQAWTADLPAELVDATRRRALTSPVDTGPCT